MTENVQKSKKDFPMNTGLKDNTPKVRAESVPLCLRHGYEGAALEHAQWLTVFLRDAVEALCTGSPDEICRGGISLCFDLLRDKLAIASGELPFPDTDILNKTDAVLWNPERKEAAHADA